MQIQSAGSPSFSPTILSGPSSVAPTTSSLYTPQSDSLGYATPSSGSGASSASPSSSSASQLAQQSEMMMFLKILTQFIEAMAEMLATADSQKSGSGSGNGMGSDGTGSSQPNSGSSGTPASGGTGGGSPASGNSGGTGGGSPASGNSGGTGGGSAASGGSGSTGGGTPSSGSGNSGATGSTGGTGGTGSTSSGSGSGSSNSGVANSANQGSDVNGNMGTDAHTSGSNVVLSNGQKFQVKGIDVGGDLVPEDWMDGTNSGQGNNGRNGYDDLTQRFGATAANSLIAEREGNWLTPADMKNIKGMGYNTIRVPFSYENFPKNADGSYNFAPMDKIVNEAAAQGLHVIPDFHVWQGQEQNYQQISGSQGGDAQKNSENLLQAFSQHYKGNGTILAIDEDNEATGSPNDQLQKGLYNAIRQGDSNRAVMIESVGYGNFSKDGFTNSIYSDHYPSLSGSGLSNYINQFSDHARPVIVGEMHGDPGQVSGATKALDAAGIGWMNWTYKGVNVGDWALENLPQSNLDLTTASYQQIQQAWDAQNLSDTTANTPLIQAYEQGTGAA